MGRLALGLGLALVAVGPVGAVAPGRTGVAGAQSAPSPAPPQVAATELPALDGSEPGTVVPHDINNAGDVVGESGGRPVLWRDGEVVELPVGDGETAAATHINDRGQVIVHVAGGNSYRWTDGEVTPIESRAAPRFLNEAGQVLLGGRGPASAHLWEDGTLTEVQPAQGAGLYPAGLSDAGHVIGNGLPPFPSISLGTAWMWHDGWLRFLSFGTVRAINGSGQAVGRSDTTTTTVWTEGAAFPLGDLGTPNDISERGQIVGVRRVGDGDLDGFLWTEGVVTDLGPMADGRFNGLPTGPAVVNERGQVAGARRRVDRAIRYFVWVGGHTVDLGPAPVHEPPMVPEVRDIPYLNRLALNDRGQLVGTLAGQGDEADRAMLWEIQDEGEPVAPDPSCVVANNWAHVRDGRAGESLGWAWAVGSGHFLGPVTDLTALRTEADTWELVDGC